ncbi:MAG: sugar ABC transporter permease [Bifidobacteriaceae bacterium]|jgi:N-acetylglucosamine transport system permease protein|nr:sugar ABC transporter permease [Bifidobacteriaceae bacterium]
MAVFLVLPLSVFAVFEVWPYLQAFRLALTDWGGFSADPNFVGLENFRKLFSDGLFLKALRNSCLLALVIPTVCLSIAFAIACLVTTAGPAVGRTRGVRGAGIYRVVSFFPYVVPAIIIGLIWGLAYSPQMGLVNGLLRALGLDSFENFPWLGSESTAMPAAMVVIVWGTTGFYVVLFVAAIKGVPAEIYDSARVDGAGRLRTAVAITLPMILENVRTGYIYLGLAALDSFVFMEALFPQARSPNYATLTITQDLFQTAFEKFRFGYATAMGIVLALVTLVYAVIIFSVFRLVRGREDWKEGTS